MCVCVGGNRGKEHQAPQGKWAMRLPNDDNYLRRKWFFDDGADQHGMHVIRSIPEDDGCRPMSHARNPLHVLQTSSPPRATGQGMHVLQGRATDVIPST